MTATDTDLAYLAGIIDADGYVTMGRSVRKGVIYYGAQVGITGSRREPHDLAASIFGGNVAAHSPTGGRSHHLTQFHWQRSGRKAAPIIEQLVPHLRVKHNRAQLVLDMQLELDMARDARDLDDPYPWFGPDFDPTAMYDGMVAEIRESSKGVAWTPREVRSA